MNVKNKQALAGLPNPLEKNLSNISQITANIQPPQFNALVPPPLGLPGMNYQNPYMFLPPGLNPLLAGNFPKDGKTANDASSNSKRIASDALRILHQQPTLTNAVFDPDADKKSVVVTNVHYLTAEPELRKHFEVLGQITRVTVSFSWLDSLNMINKFCFSRL